MEAMDIAAPMARRLETKLLLFHVDELYTSLVSDPIIVEAAVSQTRCELDRETQLLRKLGKASRWLVEINPRESQAISRSRSWQADCDTAEASASR